MVSTQSCGDGENAELNDNSKGLFSVLCTLASPRLCVKTVFGPSGLSVLRFLGCSC
jgi:hypothetical protein